VRIISATNKNLKNEIKNGNFREDLLHRLSVIPIHIPSLKERKSDIPILINHFLKLVCSESGISEKKIEPTAIEQLIKYDWPGNIRELRNVIERLVILSEEIITQNDVSLHR